MSIFCEAGVPCHGSQHKMVALCCLALPGQDLPKSWQAIEQCAKIFFETLQWSKCGSETCQNLAHGLELGKTCQNIERCTNAMPNFVVLCAKAPGCTKALQSTVHKSMPWQDLSKFWQDFGNILKDAQMPCMVFQCLVPQLGDVPTSAEHCLWVIERFFRKQERHMMARYENDVQSGKNHSKDEADDHHFGCETITILTRERNLEIHIIQWSGRRLLRE